MELTGADELIAAVERLSRINIEQLLSIIGEYLVSETKTRFEKGIGPDKNKWKELAPSTLAIPKPSSPDYPPNRKPRDPSKPILVGAGHLRDSINYQVSGNEVHCGTNKEYAPTHQFGLKLEIRPTNKLALRFYGPGGREIIVKKATLNIPARPFLGFSDDDEEEIRNIIEDYIKEVAGV